jgi:hypothetical protein
MTADFFLICENLFERYMEHGRRYKEMLVPFTHSPFFFLVACCLQLVAPFIVACLLVACSLLLVACRFFCNLILIINHYFHYLFQSFYVFFNKGMGCVGKFLNVIVGSVIHIGFGFSYGGFQANVIVGTSCCGEYSSHLVIYNLRR